MDQLCQWWRVVPFGEGQCEVPPTGGGSSCYGTGGSVGEVPTIGFGTCPQWVRYVP